MKYFEFGKQNELTLLLLHGALTTWQLSFMPFIKAAESEFHIIAVAEDGFNTDEPQTDAVSVIAEAEKITEYLVENFGGRIDIILGESLGGMIMTEILLDPRISVLTAIADGFTILEYPHFRHDLPKRLTAGAIAAAERFVLIFTIYKAYDMIFFDWFLLCRFRFFQFYYPEVAPVYDGRKYGYNLKSQLLKLIVIFPAASALAAWICSRF